MEFVEEAENQFSKSSLMSSFSIYENRMTKALSPQMDTVMWAMGLAHQANWRCSFNIHFGRNQTTFIVKIYFCVSVDSFLRNYSPKTQLNITEDYESTTSSSSTVSLAPSLSSNLKESEQGIEQNSLNFIEPDPHLPKTIEPIEGVLEEETVPTQHSDYASTRFDAIQHDAEAISEENSNSSNETEPDLVAAGVSNASLSIAALVGIIVAVIIALLVAIAIVVWFICIRGN